ncbi:MAG: MFS transporter, partial [Myxococcota bacterium]
MVRTVGYRELFRNNRDFRNLFAGRFVSLFGDWFNLLAILAMLRAFGDDSATGFAGVLLLKTLPGVLAPLGGVLADRLPRRDLMVMADVARAIVVLGMVGLAWLQSVPLLYALVIVQTLFSAVFEPARNAIFPDLVKPEELTAATAISAATWSLMLALGSAAGGLVTDGLGWEVALLLDASTYLISAAFLLRVREPDVPRAPRESSGTVFDWLGLPDIIRGARF